MPSGVNNGLSGLLQTISRLGGLRSAEQYQRLARQIQNAPEADLADLTGLRDLSPEARAAVDTAQAAQASAEEAQTAGGAASRIERQVRELRSMATQASTADMSGDERTALSARFQALQFEVDVTARNTALQGEALADRLSAPAAAEVPAATQPESADETGTEGAGSGAYDISTAEGAAAAVSGLDATLNRVAELQAEIQATQAASQQSVSSAFVEIGAAGGGGINMDPDLAADFTEELRVAVLREAATSLLIQGGFDRDSIVGMLGGA